MYECDVILVSGYTLLIVTQHVARAEVHSNYFGEYNNYCIYLII